MPKEKKTLFDALTGRFEYGQIYAAIGFGSQGKHHTESSICDDVQGILNVTLACDSDIHVSVTPHPRGDPISQVIPSHRCRTHAGGGRSEKVHKALLLLMLAIKEDAPLNDYKTRELAELCKADPKPAAQNGGAQP